MHVRGDRLWVYAAFLTCQPVLQIFREATGTEQLSTSPGGPDPVQMAEQMAFRRAAARFGLGLDLYGSAV
jgi:hypothetical protein